MHILIVSIENDLHAHVIAKYLRELYQCNVHILEVERTHADMFCTWTTSVPGAAKSPRLLWRNGGVTLELDDVDCIWWRRSRSDQRFEMDYAEDARDLISQDWRASIRGILTTVHKGSWVSEPTRTDQAAFKIVQLKAAKEVGYRIPATFISNNPEEVRQFAATQPNGVVVKPVAGTHKRILFTQVVKVDELNDEETISICPTQYQEYIRGERHLRINVFGKSVFAFEIMSKELDWRPDLRRPIRYCEIETGEAERAVLLLQRLGLKMGVFDIKVTPDGEFAFLEVNPQGQFLFLEGLTGFPLGKEFSHFLWQEARLAARADGRSRQ